MIIDQQADAVTTFPTEFLDDVTKIIGAANLKQGEAIENLDYGVTPANFGATAIAFPSCTQEVSEIVRTAVAHGISIVPQGGRSGLVGGSVSSPGQIVLSTARLNRIDQIFSIDRVAVVEAGVTLQSLQAATSEHHLEPGIDLPSRGSATIGGMVSTNAGGISAFRHGVMRHRVLGLEAVLPDGSVYSDLTRVVKNAAGYDLKHLFIGAEGTLGIVTKVAIKLEPVPATTATAIFGLPSVEAALEATRLGLSVQYGHMRAAEAIWNAFFSLTAGEHDWSAPDFSPDHPVNLLLSLGGSDDAQLQSELGRIYETLEGKYSRISAIVATSKAQEAELWRLREDTDLIYRRHAAAPSFDVSVPLSEIERYIARRTQELRSIDPAFEPYIFGHLADGNLHIVLNAAGSDLTVDKASAVERVLYRGLTESGGSFSAEHGIGSKRVHSLRETSNPVKFAMMMHIRAAIDKGRTLNPGKVTG